MVNKYKDRNPLDTIRIIREYLHSLGILVTEQWKVDYTELYSVYLSINGTNLYANGKGTSSVYALASGYSELIERLHNLAVFRIGSTIFDSDETYGCYQFQKGTYEDYYEAYKIILQFIPNSSNCNITSDGLVRYSKMKLENNNIKMLNLKSLKTNKDYYIPVNIIDYLYGTNGMVAGNTTAEAYVQGLSEILERYVTKEIYSSKITPPTLDDNFINSLENAKDIKHYKSSIESNSKYKLELKDLSLGKSIPAIGIILYDLSTASYIVKIGVHPNISIAVERCFTELMQGQLINNMRGLINISETCEQLLDIGEEPGQILPQDIAPFPIHFFRDKADYPIANQKRFINNEEMRDYLINIIHNLGYHILFRDATTCEIKVFQFIVPGMSELNNHKDDRLDKMTKWLEIGKIIQTSINVLTESDAQKILDNLEIVKFEDMSPMKALIRGLSVNNNSIYNTTPIIIFKARLFLVVKNYENAYNCFMQYNNNLKTGNKKSIYFDCFATLLSFLIKYKDMTLVTELLNKFYKEQLVKTVIEDFQNHPLQNYPSFSCDNRCNSCKFSYGCLRKNELELYYKIINSESANL